MMHESVITEAYRIAIIVEVLRIINYDDLGDEIFVIYLQ